ncbi:hypothetical protein [Desulfovibrio sp.]|uniref:hypothetical protein n=1 Tax=Desulfovibrio sp. TaxID=885 RepID=UPI0025C0D292|nr:hypothetical protein [Desulfovibrio sp.]
MFSIMLFIFLCFFGILAVLVYMLRGQERLVTQLRDEHAQLRVLLRAMESRLDHLDGTRPADAEPDDRPLADQPHSQAAPTKNVRGADPLENFSGQTRAARLTPAHEGRVADTADDPLLHLSFDPPAAHAPGRSAAGAAAVDPALDLHFDPLDMPQGARR